MDYRKIILNILLFLIVTLFSIGVIEIFLRNYKPYSGLRAGSEMRWMRNNPADLTKLYTIDQEFGFRPILGNSFYNEYATKVNSYSIEKRQNVKRLLFIGDSVTIRGKIIAALQEILGDKDFEYWNAGVESYNTLQEVNLLKKYNLAINPDHVILTFHLNDFETTPVSFYQDKKLLVYAPNTRLENINPWLFQHSYFYRLVVGLMVSLNNSSREAIIQEVQDSLTEIRDILAEKNVEFTVLVLPYLKPYREWSPIEKSSRNQIISILNQNGIPHVDLFNLLKDAVRDGINIQEEMGDFYHPSEEIAFRFAKHINDNGIFTYPIDNGR
ncbi:MAG: hypothetical protein H8E26_01710 [FCB group bacterium]|nr:hypothetical protein [FCB group bacterium]MBL7029418.1 hypothetical protein [Candidatus Neomarinimicrobiota bacterium]